MKFQMVDWFLERQAKILFFLGLVCVLLIVAVGDYRWPQSIAGVLISFVFVFIAQKLYQADTTENWLKLKLSDIVKNVLSGVFTLFGWTIFLRGVLALAIGAAVLKMG